VSPVRVPHTGSSWAYVVRGTRIPPIPKDRWSIVYSGDTPPCDDLIEAGRECDLLIHEATMMDEHKDLAVRAKHSTIGGAIEVAREMRANFTLLNHFSQRYGRLPMLDKFISNVAVTFDLMKVRFSDLQRLPYYLPYYKYAFAKHWDAQQVKAEAYSWRKYREQASMEPPDSLECSELPDNSDGATPKVSQSSVV
ncbi:Ribonuclease Z mitochondrial, partial [Fasciola hepatica]